MILSPGHMQKNTESGMNVITSTVPWESTNEVHRTTEKQKKMNSTDQIDSDHVHSEIYSVWYPDFF